MVMKSFLHKPLNYLYYIYYIYIRRVFT